MALAVVLILNNSWSQVGAQEEIDDVYSDDLKPCYGEEPYKDENGHTIYCGRLGVRCPSEVSWCHVHPTDRFAICCNK